MTFRLSELRGAHDFHRHPDVQVLLLGNLKAGRGQDMAYENRAAIDKVGKVPMRPLISLVNQSVLSLFGHAHYPYASAGLEDSPALREHHGDFQRVEQLQSEAHEYGIHAIRGIRQVSRISRPQVDAVGEPFVPDHGHRHRQPAIGEIDAMNLAGGSHGASQPDQRVTGAESDFEDRLTRLRREHPQAGLAHWAFGVFGQKVVDLADLVVEGFGLGSGQHHYATIAVPAPAGGAGFWTTMRCADSCQSRYHLFTPARRFERMCLTH